MCAADTDSWRAGAPPPSPIAARRFQTGLPSPFTLACLKRARKKLGLKETVPRACDIMCNPVWHASPGTGFARGHPLAAAFHEHCRTTAACRFQTRPGTDREGVRFWPSSIGCCPRCCGLRAALLLRDAHRFHVRRQGPALRRVKTAPGPAPAPRTRQARAGYVC